MMEEKCDLACVDKAPDDYVGQVKLVFVDLPLNIYKRKRRYACILSFADSLLFINYLSILFFALSFKMEFYINLHMFLCAAGFQYALFLGILMSNGLFGPVVHMKKNNRKCQHKFLEFFALFIGVIGTSLVMLHANTYTIKKLLHPHFLSGVVTVGLLLLSMLTGPLYRMHVFFSSLAVVASSACYILGIYSNKAFQSWFPYKHMRYFMIGACGIYTFVIFFSPLMARRVRVARNKW